MFTLRAQIAPPSVFTRQTADTKAVLHTTDKDSLAKGVLRPSLEDHMTNLELSPDTWRKSTASGTGNCVEVSFVGEFVLMRHSRSPQGPTLSFSHSEWEAFLTGVRNGEFDTEKFRSLQPPARSTIG